MTEMESTHNSLEIRCNYSQLLKLARGDRSILLLFYSILLTTTILYREITRSLVYQVQTINLNFENIPRFRYECARHGS